MINYARIVPTMDYVDQNTGKLMTVPVVYRTAVLVTLLSRTMSITREGVIRPILMPISTSRNSAKIGIMTTEAYETHSGQKLRYSKD